jgi:D-glycero-alpha-D-manno-heptose 1-phosphate guanylyltransferase
MINEAIILAGGLGTRLRSIVADLPKCMADVAGKPFLSYVINYYRKQGIEKFIFSLGYKHEVIEEYLQKEFTDIMYTASVEPEPLGTGGAIYMACSKATTENILVVNGDTLFEIKLRLLSDFHEKKNADCTLSLKKMSNTDRYGVVETDDNSKVISFKEKKYYETSIINGGVYALNVPSFMSEKFPVRFSFEKEYFELYHDTRKIYGLIQDGYFIDIGVPEDFAQAQNDLKQR